MFHGIKLVMLCVVIVILEKRRICCLLCVSFCKSMTKILSAILRHFEELEIDGQVYFPLTLLYFILQSIQRFQNYNAKKAKCVNEFFIVVCTPDELPVNLSLNCISNSIVLCTWCYSAQI